MAGMFIQESFGSSVDFPTYIPWQTLSSDLSDKLKHGSIRINRSNRVEYATIHEEGTPLIENGTHRKEPISDGSVISEAVKGGTSWPVASFLLVNAALGAGVLNYPFAYEKAGGVYFAAALQVVLMIFLISTMFVLVYCADLNYDNTYHDVLLSLCGRRAQQFAALSILLSCYGICITYLIVIGDQYSRLFLSLFGEEFCNYWYLDRRFTISATAVLFILPMCYFQRLDFLRYASTLGIFAMLYPVFLTVYEYYVLGDIPDRKVKTFPSSVVQVFAVVPVFSFAYQTHEVVVPVYACMKERNLQAFKKATYLAMAILFFVYCVSGSFGYKTFGNMVAPDIMEQYDANDPIVLIGIGALVVKMATTYPQLVLCGRGALDGLYAEFARLTTDQFISGEFKRRIVVTTGWFLTTVLLAVFTPDISVVIELLGCLASANIYIFPGLCMISLAFRNSPSLETWKSLGLVITACFIICFGVFVFGIVFMEVIIREVNSIGRPVTPGRC